MRTLTLLICLLPGLARADDLDRVLELARARAAEATFVPYRYHLEAHSWVRDGDGELEQEERTVGDYAQWSADSTRVLAEESAMIFSEDEEEPAEEDGEEKRERSVELAFDFFAPERAQDYSFRAEGMVEREGERLAEFRLRPRRKARELWKGRLWLDPRSGALRAAELEPAKGRVGMKRMVLDAELVDFAGLDLPRRIAMDIEVKIVFLFHKRISMAMDFSDYAPLSN